MNQPIKGRGTGANPTGRFETIETESYDDGWHQEPLPPIRTSVAKDSSRSVITYNQSPDIPFDRSINPYRGCEHGCIYCYARPTHSWLNLSPGLDFETKLFYKENIDTLLRDELSKPNYRCAPIALGVNTDAYQPIERRFGLTRAVIKTLVEAKHPVTIVTKSSLIERDADLLSELASDNLVSVAITITTLDRNLARALEPRATAPHRRLQTITALAQRDIPVCLMVAPVIPILTDNEMETIMQEARNAGATSAGYVMLRLPYEVDELFQQWLVQHYPAKANHVMSILKNIRNGKTNDAQFGSRMRGDGIFAELIAKRFSKQFAKLGFIRLPELSNDKFNPSCFDAQMSLF